MNNCKKYHDLILDLISSNLDDKQKAALDKHISECKECADFLLIHQKLAQSKQTIPVPNEDDFRKMRQNIIRRIRISESVPENNLVNWVKALFTRVEFAYSLAALILIFSVYQYVVPEVQENKIPTDLIEQIDYTAKQNQSLADIENSPYTYSNVEIKDIGDQQISLGFNVSTYIELTRDKNDPLVKEILAQSIMSSQQTGARLNTISYTEKLIDPKLKETLVYVLLNDPELAVRLKALNILTKYSNDSQLQDAFLNVLKNEESVQMRLSVLDYLTAHKVDTSLILNELSNATTQINQPVLLKARKYVEASKNNQ